MVVREIEFPSYFEVKSENKIFKYKKMHYDNFFVCQCFVFLAKFEQNS